MWPRRLSHRATRGLACQRERRLADRQHAAKVHRMQTHPCLVKTHPLRPVIVGVLVEHRIRVLDLSKRCTPFSEEHLTPRQSKTPSHISCIQVRVLVGALELENAAFDYAPTR